ncbi:MAG: BON domain-containing protein [Desulfuromonadaceae bacterium]|nr:BON domain-containing protein [Desulfuromonas sp.]MDY0186025.1 BON domain-containing protein [Desulfuromonadaceae bacterium]
MVCALVVLVVATATATESKNDERKSDVWLKANIVTSYTLNQNLNPFDFDVEVENGIVSLSGTVDSEVEKDLAIEIAKGVEGVKDVNSSIMIEPGTKAEERKEPEFFRTVEDATITAKVKSRLLWNRNTNGMDINVVTENAVVTLKGKVASAAQGDLAAQMAKNTTGVERVMKEFEIVPEPKKAEKKGTLETIEEKTNDAWITTKVKSMLLFSKEADGVDISVASL